MQLDTDIYDIIGIKYRIFALLILILTQAGALSHILYFT